MHVEDHPLEYASFEGEIPKGQYGAGTVELWDRGTYELVEEKRDGGLTVRLHGERLEGVWTLVPAHLDGKEQNWLLLRKRDDEARRAAGASYRPMLATLAEPSSRGAAGWLLRGEVRRLPCDRLRARRRVRLRSRDGNDLTGALRGRRHGRS